MRSDTPYFTALSAALRAADIATPRLVVDLECVEQNVTSLLELHDSEKIRIVAKSLPCPELLAHVFGITGHQRLMVFHLPFLLRLVEHFPAADILMGKPMPGAAPRQFYRHRVSNSFDDERQLQWLVDTPERLRQIAELGADIGRRIAVNIELDVGMHRGGIADRKTLKQVLDTARSNRNSVRIAGFMGYDAHVPRAPIPGSVGSAAKKVQSRYREFLDIACNDYGDLEEQAWCVNGAGSPTISMHDETSPLNDFSVGSALVKPVGFDLPSLTDFQPAAWIASPVLKRLAGVRVPFLEKLPAGNRDTLFIYGGRWLASPVFPASLKENRLYGYSSNQQMLTIASNSDIAVDDFVFLRPEQSEAVFLQFGDLLIARRAELIDEWPTL